MKGLLVILLVLPVLVWADARFVEAPAECHFPYDNANVGAEFKVQSCRGSLRDYGNGTVAVGINESQKGLSANLFVVGGQDVTDTEAYPSGELMITTTGAESGTDCNIVDANGTAYASGTWTATTTIRRTPARWRVDIDYTLECWGAVEVVQ